MKIIDGVIIAENEEESKLVKSQFDGEHDSLETGITWGEDDNNTSGSLLTKEYLNSVIKIVLEADKRDEKFIAEIEKRIQQAEQKLKEQATALYFEDITNETSPSPTPIKPLRRHGKA